MPNTYAPFTESEPTLTERRKTDRRQMAERVAELAKKHGLQVEIEPEPTFLGDRATIVNIRHVSGARLSLDFDGKSCQPDVFVVSWRICDSDATFAPAFAQSHNEYHRQKATDICEGFDVLLGTLNNRFRKLADGAAYAVATVS